MQSIQHDLFLKKQNVPCKLKGHVTPPLPATLSKPQQKLRLVAVAASQNEWCPKLTAASKPSLSIALKLQVATQVCFVSRGI